MEAVQDPRGRGMRLRLQYDTMTLSTVALRVGIIGGGTIARLFLEHIRRGKLGKAKVVAVLGRAGSSRGRALAKEFGVSFVTDLKGLLRHKPDVVVEAAGHDAVRQHAEPILRKRV